MSKQRKGGLLIDFNGKRYTVNQSDFIILLGALKVCQNHTGNNTPIEDTLRSALRSYGQGEFSFGELEDMIAEAKETLPWIRRDLRAYATYYREELDAAVAEADAERAAAQTQRKPAASQNQPSNVKEMSA